MNIAEILKDCPKGTKLYCPIYGTVIFVEVDESRIHSIITRILNEALNISFTKDGKINDHYDGECVLFPSKENRDWSTFKAPKEKYELKPFDKVLVRHDEGDIWQGDLFSSISYNQDNLRYYLCIGGAWNECIPYEGNEHFLNTNDNPKCL